MGMTKGRDTTPGAEALEQLIERASGERISGVFASPRTEPRPEARGAAPVEPRPDRPVRLSFLLRDGLAVPTGLLYPGLAVVAVGPHDLGAVNARVLDASADPCLLAAALRSAVTTPPWVAGELTVSPPIFLCGAVPPALAELAVRSSATAGVDLNHTSLTLMTTAAVADASTHAEIDPRSKLEWAATTLGEWAATFFPTATLPPRERTILGLRLLDVSRDEMTQLLACSTRDRLDRTISRLLHRIRKRDLEVAVGPIVRRFEERGPSLAARTYVTVRPSRRHDLLATPPEGRARPTDPER